MVTLTTVFPTLLKVDETLIVETAVWPIPSLIIVFTALKGWQF